jgi:hypothetical protein
LRFPTDRGWWVAALASLTVLLYLLPTLLYHRDHSWEFFPRYVYDEEYYGVLAASTARGEPLMGNPYLGERVPGKVSAEVITFLPLFVASGLVHLLGVGKAFAAIFVISALGVWLLLYGLLRRLGVDRGWAGAGACGVLLLPYALFPFVVAVKTAAGVALHHSIFSVDLLAGLPLLRRFNPALSAIGWFGYLYLHWRAAASGKPRDAYLAAIVGGLLFYCYFFFGATALVLAGLWAVVQIAVLRERVKDAIAPVLVQVAVVAPFLFLILQNVGDYQASVGVPGRRLPYLPWPHMLAMLAAIGWLLLRGWKERRLPHLWLSALGLAPLLAMNQQVLTGVFVEPWHFDAYLYGPMTSLLLCAAAGLEWRERSWRGSPLLAGGFAALALIYGLSVQMMVAGRIRGEENAADYAGAFDGVRGATRPGDVILSDAGSPLPSWLVLHTGRRVYVSQFLAFLPVANRQEYRQRALCYYWLRGDNPVAFDAEAIEDRASVLYNADGDRYWFFPALLTDVVRRERLREYQACGANPEGCCPATLPVNWVLETGAMRFSRERIERLFRVQRIVAGAGYRLLEVQRLPSTAVASAASGGSEP